MLRTAFGSPTFLARFAAVLAASAPFAAAQMASIEWRVSLDGALGLPNTIWENDPQNTSGIPGDLTLAMMPAVTNGVMTLEGGWTILAAKTPGANGRSLTVTSVHGHADPGAFPPMAGTIDIYVCYRFNGPTLTVPAPNRFTRTVAGSLVNLTTGTIDLAGLRYNAGPNGACVIAPGDPGFYSVSAFAGAASPVPFFDTVVYGRSPVPCVDITTVTRLIVFRNGDGVLLPASAEASVVHDPNATVVIHESAQNFLDLSSSGNSLGIPSDDGEFNLSASQLASAGFQGNELLALADIRVGNNGAVLWNATSGEIGYVNNRSLETMNASNGLDTGNGGTQPGVQLVCPLWDDHWPNGSTSIRWQVLGGDLVIQWTNEGHYNVQGTDATKFQMVVRGNATVASGQPLVEFVYDDTLYASAAYQNDGGSATIGLKNWGVVSGANDVQYRFGGGNETLQDPAYGESNMVTKVGGWNAAEDAGLPHSIVIRGLGPGSVVRYCTSSTSTNGCVATIGSSGVPSVSLGPGGFFVEGSGIEGQKQGLIFYGVSGQISAPWGAGGTSFLCVKAPTQRTGTQNSGGTVSSCDGLLALDVFAFEQSHFGALGVPIQAGDGMWFQGWFRDPPSVKTTNLTDGLQVTYLP